MKFRNQDLGFECAYCYWDIFTARVFTDRTEKYIEVYRNIEKGRDTSCK